MSVVTGFGNIRMGVFDRDGLDQLRISFCNEVSVTVINYFNSDPVLFGVVPYVSNMTLALSDSVDIDSRLCKHDRTEAPDMIRIISGDGDACLSRQWCSIQSFEREFKRIFIGPSPAAQNLSESRYW